MAEFTAFLAGLAPYLALAMALACLMAGMAVVLALGMLPPRDGEE